VGLGRGRGGVECVSFLFLRMGLLIDRVSEIGWDLRGCHCRPSPRAARLDGTTGEGVLVRAHSEDRKIGCGHQEAILVQVQKASKSGEPQESLILFKSRHEVSRLNALRAARLNAPNARLFSSSSDIQSTY
jgi:hypothetical protein